MEHLIIVTTTALTAVAVSGFLLPYRVEHSEIATATPEQAWKTITDLQNHPTWNPNVVRLEGQPVVGTRLINRTRSDTTEMTFHPEVIVAEPNRELRWRGSLGVRGLADGEHYYRIDPGPTPGQVTITQGEVFRGELVTLLRPFFNLAAKFAVSTKSLAEHVEKQG